jgi:UDP-hydrolysing UDP-N-acetyl-D-glucosamine 2-epimerase
MKAIKAHPDLELQLIVAGGALLNKYGDFVEDGKLNEFDVDLKIYFLLEGENPLTMAKSTGIALTEFATAFDSLEPDVVMTIADRFEEIAIATAATMQNIPLAHIEGGEVSGSVDESIRHSITKMSHLHFPSTERAAERITNLGEPEENVFTVGTPSLDSISNLDLEAIDSLDETINSSGVGAAVDLHEEYLLVIQHPITTEYEQNRRYIDETIEAIDNLGLPTVWLWPNMDAGSDAVSRGIREYRQQEETGNIRWLTSLPIEKYGKLLNNATCIVGNSSSGIRESSFLGVPAVNIGNRQIGRERGENAVDVSHDAAEIKDAILDQVEHGPYEPEYIYGNGESGERIAEVIADFGFEIQKQITF